MSTEARDRWEKYAPARAAAAVKSINLLGNCSSKRDYEYTRMEAAALVASIDEALEAVATRFGLDTTKETPPAPAAPATVLGDPKSGFFMSRELWAKVGEAMDHLEHDHPAMELLKEVIVG